ncbi:class I tRNA ligase family protein [Tenacibaculum pacificus]|uniref:class I tRNA ligase family protein n=1 Tax=Tenacibaculum pacificus TaxID=3018314 RepID=UPI0022F3C83E|nr:class I tRNA ligase family protein [Tenacibaculum pacificus]WBX73859.1 class I tRNA ligase family protein [Tenacibaculum pacificus]
MQYNHQDIEKKWQQFWADNQTFKASNESEKPKYYVLDMFPYPSGAGLHVGHPLGYIASDIYARYKRHKGFNVLHPQGYDSFGLPAEQYAIQTGQHPAITTETNINTYRRQLDTIGFSFDWSREVRTSSPEYYKWTQWIFIQLFNSWYNKDSDKAEDVSTLISVFETEGNASVNAVSEEDIAVFSAEQWNGFSDKEKEAILLQYRLTYLSDTEVNWCPGLGTVLANDEIINGVSERGAHPVIRKKMTQWSMRISAYSQRLLDGLENIDWPQPLKDSQTNWIGRSEGAMVTFKVDALEVEAGVKLSFKELEALKEMRLNLSKAEEVLWNELKNKKGASKFRKKYTIGTFLVDYVCLAKNIVVEFSGKEDEAARTTYFTNEGLHIVRFTNEEVLENVLGVVSKINNTIQFAKPLEKSTVEVAETVVQNDYKIDVFTTRPDTIYGVSFMTLAPEHELVTKITSESQKKAVYAYIKATAKRSERDRMADVKTISGVFTGAYALHPFTGKQVPIWIGDYVLANYGTGAVMAVPCGDQRDYDFAKNFGLEIPNIFADVDISENAHADKEGTKIANSDFLDGLSYKKAVKLAIYEMEKQGFGFGKINYRLRDAVFSRQRYWGEPFPVFYKDGMPQMIDAKYLPIVLPEVEKYLPTEDGKPPLGNAEVWAWDTEKNEVVSNDLINNETIFNLELNTMPGWAGSSWYFNRYMDATNDGEFVSKEAADYWKEIDLYIGGSEHATGHLLYARFWQKFLFDKGALPVDEFAKKLINQGMILGTSALVYEALFDGKKHNLYVSADYFQGENQIEDTEADDKLGSRLHKKLVEAGLTEETEESLTYRPIHICVSTLEGDININIDKLKAWRSEFETAEFVFGRDNQFVCYREVEKMSKSKHNVVNPDLICEEFGADALRLFEMFLGPLEQTKPWKTSGISGVYSFLKKLWKLYVGEEGVIVTEAEPTKEELKVLHKTIKKVEEDIENFSFNTSVSTFMIAVNELTALKCNKRAILEPILALISPYAPHIAEELWNQLGHEGSISTIDFPIFEASYLVESSKNYPVSFNGKMRFTLELALDLSKEEIEKIVMADERTIAQLKGETPKKVIIVPGKIINIVG